LDLGPMRRAMNGDVAACGAAIAVPVANRSERGIRVWGDRRRRFKAGFNAGRAERLLWPVRSPILGSPAFRVVGAERD